MYRRTGRGRVLLIVFLGLCVVIITLDFRQGENGPLDRARDVSAAVVDPIQRGFTALFRPVGDLVSSIGELGNLREDNAELKALVEDYEGRIEEADSVAAENERLRDMLDLDEAYPSMERVTAEVISRSPSNYKWLVKIDKGTADGVRPDMAVISPDGLVGKIAAAKENSSTVLLLIDSIGAAAAKTDDGEAQGLVTGNGAGEPLAFEFVDSTADVELGDEVVTSSYNGGIFPPNIPIGRVSFVSAETAALEQDIDVEPYVDFQSIEFVQVLLESGPKIDERAGE
jgi:rod shape-determining protein MreC